MSYSETFAKHEKMLRDKLHEMLQTLPDDHRKTFHLMYNHKNIHDRDVDGVRTDQLDWAFYQVENGIKKLKQSSTEPKEKK